MNVKTPQVAIQPLHLNKRSSHQRQWHRFNQAVGEGVLELLLKINCLPFENKPVLSKLLLALASDAMLNLQS